MRILKKIGKVLLCTFALFQCYVLARLYIFASCVIPTGSMTPTLQKGDYIIASLQIPGCRAWKEDSCGHLSVHRKKGIRKVRKGDVVVFNFPYASGKDRMRLEPKLYYCKRCVAVPGETYKWKAKARERQVYLPCRGEELAIDSLNYRDYRKCIAYETREQVTRKGSTILLGDSVIRSYRFRQDYYFMRGDNVSDSYDSRNWGILPEDFILGVGRFVWFSRDKKSGKVRWERIFKKI